MKKNMGSADRIIRISLAVIIGVLFLTKTISSTLGIILGVVAIIFLVTSAVGFCPLYALLGLSTTKKEAK